jgi:hypothetical protein
MTTLASLLVLTGFSTRWRTTCFRRSISARPVSARSANPMSASSVPDRNSRASRSSLAIPESRLGARVPETFAKLLVRDLEAEVPPLRERVEKTLDILQEAGYVARDEATLNGNGEQRIGRTFGATVPVLDPTNRPSHGRPDKMTLLS